MPTLIKQAAWMVGDPISEKVVLLHNEGLNLREIGDIVELSRERVRKILHAEMRAEEYEAYTMFYPDDDSIWMLNEPLSVRAYNATRVMGIGTKTEYRALDRAQIVKVKNLGHGTFNELEEKLAGRPPIPMREYLALLST